MKKTFAWILTMVMCLSMFSGMAMAESFTYADTIAWDGEYDVVVAGFGNAGGTAAASAAEAGAKVLLVEKAPESAAGGNSRVCGQLFVYGHEDEEATYNYYRAMARTKEVPDAMLRVYTEKIAHMYDYVAEMFDLDKSEFFSFPSDDPAVGAMSPEYPEFPGSDKISLNALHNGRNDGYLWKQVVERVEENKDNVDVWYESPAVNLIQDPVTKVIIGVQVEREGKMLNIRAKNGVVLATGGFECNPDMVEAFLGYPESDYSGGNYNTGDGIRMAMDVGAALWHMDVFEGSMVGGHIMMPGKNGYLASTVATAQFGFGSSILVGEDGSRYAREDETSRHGHIYEHGIWENPARPLRSFLVYDSAKAAQAGDLGIYQEYVIEAATLEELAEKTGMNAEILNRTITRFNGYAATGEDIEFGRSAASMAAFAAEGPYYAIETIPGTLNTQGGPRRNENAEVLDHDGNPIPHLYSAGELGGICSLHYQGGGNVAECLIFGDIAGKNAAQPKEEITHELKKVESNLVYMPGAVSDLIKEETVTYEVGENEYIGISENGMGGKVVVKVTMDGDKIAAVEVIEQNETKGIADAALNTVPGAIVAANSIEVDTASGATITSKAIIEAVANALAQVK